MPWAVQQLDLVRITCMRGRLQSIRAEQFEHSLADFINVFPTINTAQSVIALESLGMKLDASDVHEAGSEHASKLKSVISSLRKAAAHARTLFSTYGNHPTPAQDNEVRKLMQAMVYDAMLRFKDLHGDIKATVRKLKKAEDAHSLMKCADPWEYTPVMSQHDRGDYNRRRSRSRSPRANYRSPSRGRSRARSPSRGRSRARSPPRSSKRSPSRGRRSPSRGRRSPSRSRDDSYGPARDADKMRQLSVAIGQDRKFDAAKYDGTGCFNCIFTGRGPMTARGHKLQDCKNIADGFRKMAGGLSAAARAATPRSASKLA
jgi:hypothetical protein